jgi:hypothetical protein
LTRRTQFLPNGSVDAFLRKGAVPVDIVTLVRMAKDAGKHARSPRR